MYEETRKTEPKGTGGYEPTDPAYPKYHVTIECKGLPGGAAYLDGPHTFSLAERVTVTSIALVRERSEDGHPTLRLEVR